MKSSIEKSNILYYIYFIIIQDEKLVRLIIGGGDGTIIWAIEEMIKYKIDFMKCPIGTIPLGTGNDFSRVKYCDLNNNWFPRL